MSVYGIICLYPGICERVWNNMLIMPKAYRSMCGIIGIAPTTQLTGSL